MRHDPVEHGPVSIGLVGLGYWGSKLARNLFESPACDLAHVCDADPDRLRQAGRFPGAQAIQSYDDLLNSSIDAVVLATPASQHREMALRALAAGKHVFVEKPLALNSDDSIDLVRAAADADRVLMVGHTFLYSEPVLRLRELIERGDLGVLQYLYGQRLNLGIIRDDLNALWNFGPHDVSIMLYLVDEMPVRVSARSFSILQHDFEDVAFVVLEFPGDVVAHIHESWLDPRKVRQFTVVGDKKMVIYDDTSPETPLALYDKGVHRVPNRPPTDYPEEEDFADFKLKVRAGDVILPKVDLREPLRVEMEHFATCVATGRSPRTDGEHGLQVVSILEAAERSAALGGAAVEPVTGGRAVAS